MYPSPDLDLTIATAVQRERIARHWRRRPSAPAAAAPTARRSTRRSTRRTAFSPGTNPA